LTTADIYDALSSSRPYRCKLAHEEVLKLMKRDVPNALNNYCLEALAIASQNIAQQIR
jgi:HD-GYP domain-containing protein (c-di-GMP phosphodiesterase class II)